MSSPSPTPLEAVIEALRGPVGLAETALRSGESGRWREGLKACEEALAVLHTAVVKAGPEEKPALPVELAGPGLQIWWLRGRLLESLASAQSDAQALVGALRCYDQVIALAQQTPGRADILVAAWMNRAGGLLRLGAPDAPAEAVRSYDQVIPLLEKRDAPDAAMLGWAWMNRGVALLSFDEEREAAGSRPVRLQDAARSLERAVAVLEPAAVSQEPARRHLAAAWANIGLARARLEDAAGAAEAHRRGVECFRPQAAGGGAAGRFELAVRLYNLGQACGAAGEADAALVATREALRLAEGLKSDDAPVVELRLRSRHAICVVLGGRLAAGRAQAGDAERAARLEEAGDLVEDGLAGVRGRGALPGSVAQAAVKLYEFGAWLYRTQQPHFLGEFLLEHLGEDEARANVAAAAVGAARQELVKRGFQEPAHGGMRRALDVLRELGEVEKRIGARGAAV